MTYADIFAGAGVLGAKGVRNPKGCNVTSKKDYRRVQKRIQNTVKYLKWSFFGKMINRLKPLKF